MKTIFLILIIFITQSFLNVKAQYAFTDEIILKIYDWRNRAISKTGSITFTVEGKVYHAKYNREKLHYFFDSLPFVKGFLNVQCRGYDPQKYFTYPQNLVFKLGVKGFGYSVGGNGLLYPYLKGRGIYGVELSARDREARGYIKRRIKPFFDLLHLSIGSYYYPTSSTYYIQLKATKRHDPKKMISELLKHQLINYAGEAFMLLDQIEEEILPDITTLFMDYKLCFFPNRLFLEFEKAYNLPDDAAILQITSEEKKRILDKYGLAPDPAYKSADFQHRYVQITDSILGTVNEVAKLLLLEPAVKKVSVPYTEFSPN